jgi:creatinine amidohydrolase
MRLFTSVLVLISAYSVVQGQTSSKKGILLEDLTWMEAEKVLNSNTIVVIPLGAESKEHGPHLKLKNDWLMAEYLKQRVLAEANVVVAPTINYNFYPAFLEYPGSTSLRLQTARDLVAEICHSLASYGPHRFYIINTGVSTLRALKPAAEALAKDGILLRYSDINAIMQPVTRTLAKEAGGTHADEVETSLMLYMAPETVDMSKAVKDFNPDNPGPLTRNPNGKGVYSPTGIWGDPTLATQDKGRVFTEALVAGILKEIEETRGIPLPNLP